MKILENGNIEHIDMFYRCDLNIAFICDGCGECEILHKEEKKC